MLLWISFTNVYGCLVIGEIMSFDDYDKDLKEKKELDELPAGLLSLLFMGISLGLLPIFLNLVKLDHNSNSYKALFIVAVIAIIVEVALLILEIVFPLRLFINYLINRKMRSISILAVCGMSVFVIFVMIVLGIIFML